MWILPLILLLLPIFVQAIIGGKEVSHPHKYPWIVALHRTESFGTESHFCGGSIISKDVVLTAAHCVTETSTIFIQAGHSNISSESSAFLHVKSILIHPEYDSLWIFQLFWSLLYGPRLYDIALLRLNESLVFNDSIQPIALPSEGLSKFTYYVAGWGLTGIITEDMPDNECNYKKHFKEPQNLRELEIEIAQDDSCFVLSDYIDYIDSYVICGQSFKPLEEGTCNGDSGSPLMKIEHVSGRTEVIGITSGKVRYPYKQPYFNTCNGKSIYTRVSKYLPWIYQNLKEFDPRFVSHVGYKHYLTFENIGIGCFCLCAFGWRMSTHIFEFLNS